MTKIMSLIIATVIIGSITTVPVAFAHLDVCEQPSIRGLENVWHGLCDLQEQIDGISWDNLPGIPDDFADGVDNVDDADADPTNELQTLVKTVREVSLSPPESLDPRCEISGDAVSCTVSCESNEVAVIGKVSATSSGGLGTPVSSTAIVYPEGNSITHVFEGYLSGGTTVGGIQIDCLSLSP